MGAAPSTSPRPRRLWRLPWGRPWPSMGTPRRAPPVGPRREIGIRTVFNILGPLTNPARVKAQVLGVAEPRLTTMMAQVLQRLGSQHAFVVCGADGIDEISVCGPTYVAEVRHGTVRQYGVTPEELGVKRAPFEEIKGADAISVLTDEEFYHGSLDDLRAIRAAVPTPVLRKDFILDRYGLLEARAAGADLVLLIVAALAIGPQGRSALSALVEEARVLGLTPLVEVYTAEEAWVALEIGAELVGVNNRNLHTFEVSLETTERLAPLLAPHTLVVSL